MKATWQANKDEYNRQYQAEKRASSREIGEIRSCAHPRRRASTKRDFGKFCKTYFPAAFYLPWSPNHLRAAERIEKAVLDGGLFAFALPRGSGKTTLCEWATLWSLLHAHHHFVLLIGATEQKAKERLRSIGVELRRNELLAEDFPEVIQPIQSLGTAVKQAGYQTCHGEPTAIEWITTKIVLPTVANTKGKTYPTSGGIIQVAGITGGEIRGLSHKKQDGTIIRPSLAIADDPQTRESSKSPSQSQLRAQTLAADVAFCAGPGMPISVIVPCTVIYQGDMAHQITDRDLHPEYQGIRTKMLEKFPENMVLWEKYAEIWRDSLRNDGDMTPATEFYRENRKAMDLGAEVTWPERFTEAEASAIQHAMNFFYRDEPAFWSECQNEPAEDHQAADVACKPEEMLAKVTGYARFMCPNDTTAVTAFVDVQHRNLYYMVVAWQPGFSGQIIDYGVWPDQGQYRSMAQAEIRKKFDQALLGLTMDQQVYKALGVLISELSMRSYPLDRGGEQRIEQILVDASDGQLNNTIYQFCREFRAGTKVHPSHGRYVGAKSQPWAQWKRKQGEKVGPHWRLRKSEEWPIRHVIYDANWWKTFVHQRLKAPFGGEGTIGIYGLTGDGRKLDPRHHLDLVDQVCRSEYPVQVTALERTVMEWQERPNRPDNHMLDCLVGAAVGASMCGIEMEANRTWRRGSGKPAVNFAAQYRQNVLKS